MEVQPSLILAFCLFAEGQYQLYAEVFEDRVMHGKNLVTHTFSHFFFEEEKMFPILLKWKSLPLCFLGIGDVKVSTAFTARVGHSPRGLNFMFTYPAIWKEIASRELLLSSRNLYSSWTKRMPSLMMYFYSVHFFVVYFWVRLWSNMLFNKKCYSYVLLGTFSAKFFINFLCNSILARGVVTCINVQ